MSEPHFLNLVIGTAGHIDHGKSALVERLTGQHPDTLKEEQERGLTINIGYAAMRLSDGRKVGIIDVPGHERFIKNMVAGATGIRFVVFVIAADDSIMPQSREHLDILKILGVEQGVVALTKIDLVDEETVEIAIEEIRDFVKGTFLEASTIYPVSSIDGTGIDDLRAHLDEALVEIDATVADMPFRLPIQRTFSASGYGTVVTGVPISGDVRIGDTLEILPQGATSRVRGLEAYGERIEEATAGHRTAVNLSDADYRTVLRGHVLVAPGLYRASRFVEVRLDYLPGNAKPLKHLAPIRCLAGTSEAVGRVSLLDRKALEPGESAPVQLFLQEPLVVAEGDRYILRTISPMTTIGGGIVIGAAPTRHRRFRDWTLEHLERKEDAIGVDPHRYLAEVVHGYGRAPAGTRELARDVHRPPGEVEAMLAKLAADGVVVPLHGGRYFLHELILNRMSVEIVGSIETLYRSYPLSLFVPMRDLAKRLKLDGTVLDGVLECLGARGTIRRGPQGRLGLPDHAPKITAKQREIRDRIRSVFRESFLAPPSRAEIPSRVDAGKDETLRLTDLLLDQGELARLKDDTLLHREAIHEAATRVREALRERERMTASEIRELLGTTRKVLIPLLEHLDVTGVTRRDGDHRMLPQQGESNEPS